MGLNILKKWLTISETISDYKRWKIWQICASKLLIWRQKWTAGVRHGTSLVVRRVWSGRIIVVLFWSKYAFPRQIKPGIFKLTTCRGHSYLLTVFSFVNCEEKGCHRVVSVGHLIFDCRSYCGRSCRMQGSGFDSGFPIKIKRAWARVMVTLNLWKKILEEVSSNVIHLILMLMKQSKASWFLLREIFL